MAQVKVKGNQLNIQDVATSLANDSTAISTIGNGILNDPSAVASYDNKYLKLDGTNQPSGTLNFGGQNITNVGLINGRDVATDGTTLDGHTADTSIHFTVASIDHALIQNVGVNTHAQIDSHIANVNIHRSINDASTATTDLWSANKISSELANKSDVTHTHVLNDLTDVDLTVAPTGDQVLRYDGVSNLWKAMDVVIGATNIGVGGFDIFSTLNVNVLEFKGLAAATGDRIVLANDNTNNNVTIDVNSVLVFNSATLEDIGNVQPNGSVGSYQDGDHILYDLASTSWIASSFASDVTLELGNNGISALQDVSALTPSTSDGLVFDGSVWTNQAIVNSFNGRTGTVLPIAGDYDASQITNTPAGNITGTDVQTAINELDTALTSHSSDTANPHMTSVSNLTDTTLTSPSIGNFLYYDGSSWINKDAYIDDLADVNITKSGSPLVATPATGDLLRYDGTNWVNYPDSNYEPANPNIQAHISDTANPHGTSLSNLTDTTLTSVSSDQLLYYNASSNMWENFTLTLEFVSDVNYVGSPAMPVSGDILTYNGTSWENSQVLSQHMTASNPHGTTLTDIVDVNITSPIDLQGLVYNGASAQWENQDIVNSFNGRVGAVSPQAGDYSAADITFIPSVGSPQDISSTNVQSAVEEVYNKKVNLVQGNANNVAILDGSGQLQDSGTPINITTTSVVTATYTVAPTDEVLLIDASGGNITITLHAATVGRSRPLVVKRLDDPSVTSNTVTINAATGDSIDGGTSITLSAQYVYNQLITDGNTNWYIIG